ncbi:MAG TPA: hypothetical protein VGE01_05965 [Fimbriimonas sp.]
MKKFFALSLALFAATAFADNCCPKPAAASDEAFLREANMMMLKAEGKQACDRTTATKAVVKGQAGCCEAPGEPKLFKVFVAGKGYAFYSCPDSAGQARKKLLAAGTKVGPVQKVAKK